MTRVLNFEGEKAAKRFELCHRSVLAGGDGKGDRGRETRKKEARLLDAFDTISTPTPSADASDPDARTLHPTGGTVHLRQDDLALLEKYVDCMPWLPRVVREVEDLQEWLNAADKVDD